MSEVYYREALKKGLKEQRARAAKGLSTCLPVLDDFIPAERSMAAADLGVTEIPAEFIVGTKTRGRVNSFAPNFMPVLDVKTEFSDKWIRLCQAHLAEGIREPIKVYEYLNRYYVEEGNKRVSVLKFFDAPRITAHVLRVMPERTPEKELYFEFVEFYRKSRVNYIEFTKKGGYALLQKLLGKAPDEAWSEDEVRRFSTVYHYFRQAYAARACTRRRGTRCWRIWRYTAIPPCGARTHSSSRRCSPRCGRRSPCSRRKTLWRCA